MTEITGIQTLSITNALLWTNFQMMRREGGDSAGEERRVKSQINSGLAKLHRKSPL